MTNLNDTSSSGKLRAEDFDNLESRETAMLTGRTPMVFQPIWYRTGLAACTGDACRSGRDKCPTPDACRIAAERGDSEFGALEGMVKGRWWVMAPWIVLGLAALAAMFWPF